MQKTTIYFTPIKISLMQWKTAMKKAIEYLDIHKKLD